MDDDIDNLDLSWTEEYNRTLNSQAIPFCEPMQNILLHFIYIGSTSEITKVITEPCSLEILDNGSGSCLSELRILQLIQVKRTLQDVMYKLDDILLYFVTLDPNHLADYAKAPSWTHSFFKSNSSMPSNIIVPPSIFIFHSCNSIYFVFKEMVLVEPATNNRLLHHLPSILKKGPSNKKTTKRVRISPDTPYLNNQDKLTKVRKTAKIFIGDDL